MTSPATAARALLDELADAWNRGDAAAGANCFTEDAVYLEPPDRQYYVGRDQLFSFFGGDQPGEASMSMTWHHVAVDEAADRVFGEYTYTGNNTYHGVVVIQLRDGLISSWREYQYRSTLPFTEFAGDSLRS
jgi:uncharacterized protein (TIGR02246 family)